MTRDEAYRVVLLIGESILASRYKIEHDYSIDPRVEAQRLTESLINTVLEHVSLSEQRRDRENIG